MIRNQPVTICQDLRNAAQEAPVELAIHSRFDHAVNYRSRVGLVTLLPRERALQPYSIRLEGTGDFARKAAVPEVLLLTGEQLLDRSGDTWVRFARTRSVDLRMRNRYLPEVRHAESIRQFLAERPEGGLHGMLEGSDDFLISFVRPRIQRFREAFLQGGIDEIAETVSGFAGCGPGLTPSTDDFLSGYIAFLPQQEYGSLTRRMTETAASKTNEISASLLTRSGQGLFSEDIIKLEKAFRTADDAGIRQALTRVAEFGSSSGCDFLTGASYGIRDANAIANQGGGK